jgi:indolepyruvate ferredoxin oxidoreductase beta subunit
MPKPRAASEPRPILALAPGIGDVDLVVASELMEAGRAVAGGFVTPDRTMTIASTSRSYLVTEKMAMGDGRYDSDRLIAAVERNSRHALLLDLEAVARNSGAMINAVMLGVIAETGALPISAEAFEAAIRADGKAVEANLRGFRAGREAARAGAGPRAAPAKRHTAALDTVAALEAEIGASQAPEPARAIMVEGVRRLARYQDAAYARLYLDRLAPIGEADRKAGAGGRLLAETARQLALRMSYEDVIRVASAKLDPTRISRIASEMRLSPANVFTVTEYLKPGLEEICSVLPPSVAGALLKLGDRIPAFGRLHFGMALNSSSVLGHLRLRALAALRPYRPRTFRYRNEQAAIEAWLDLIARGATQSAGLAIEIASCARLIKGYGDTHRRGTENFARIVGAVIEPALSGAIPAPRAADAVASAVAAALRDPEGESLSQCLAALATAAPHALAAE